MVFMRWWSSFGPRAVRAMAVRPRGGALGLAALGLAACGFFWAGAAEPVPWAQASCPPPEFLDAKLIAGFFLGVAVATLGGCLFRLRRSMVAKQVRSAMEARIATQEHLVRGFQGELFQGVQDLIATLQRVARDNPAARVAIEGALSRAEALLIESGDRLRALQGANADDPVK